MGGGGGGWSPYRPVVGLTVIRHSLGQRNGDRQRLSGRV